MLLRRPRMRSFFDLAVADMVNGRETWRVIAVMSGAAAVTTALYFSWF